MSRALFVLVASLAANIALAVALAHARFNGVSWPSAAGTHLSGAHFSLEPKRGENPATPLPSMLPTAFHWRQLEASDYRQHIANLRAIGCPEETTRDLIISEINKLYAPRFAALLRQTNLFGWRHAGAPATAALNEQLRAVRREKRDVLKELLGVSCHEESQIISGMLAPRD